MAAMTADDIVFEWKKTGLVNELPVWVGNDPVGLMKVNVEKRAWWDNRPLPDETRSYKLLIFSDPESNFDGLPLDAETLDEAKVEAETRLRAYAVKAREEVAA